MAVSHPVELKKLRKVPSDSFSDLLSDDLADDDDEEAVVE